MGSKSRKRRASGVGGEKKSGCQEKEESSKWRRSLGVREGIVEGERRRGRIRHSHYMNLSCNN